MCPVADKGTGEACFKGYHTLDLMLFEPILMTNSAIAPTTLLMLAHCAIGLGAALVAQRKGYDLGLWILWGTLGGTVALIDALRRPRRTLPPPS